MILGRTGGTKITVETYGSGNHTIPLADLRAAHEGFFPALMQGELGVG